MKDIALLKTVGMRPVVVHDTPMGADKFRENKRIAKLIELCGVKAIGICGMDLDTLHMALDNDFIPVVEQGVNRVHLVDGRIPHALILEFFSKAGVGTIIIKEKDILYPHELELDE